MIVLHNLQGEPFAVNAELIERVDGYPEARVTLVTGTTYVAVEDLDEVIRLARQDRAVVQAMAMRLSADPDLFREVRLAQRLEPELEEDRPHDPELHLVPGDPRPEADS